MAGFGICSALCGLAPSLGLLVAFRVMQGLCGGPIMPMSQTLMMRHLPQRRSQRRAGALVDDDHARADRRPDARRPDLRQRGWPWVFYINVPVAAVCAFFAWRMLTPHETPTGRQPVDFVGLALLVVWVGALQIMLDKGKELDWFGSPIRSSRCRSSRRSASPLSDLGADRRTPDRRPERLRHSRLHRRGDH